MTKTLKLPADRKTMRKVFKKKSIKRKWPPKKPGVEGDIDMQMGKKKRKATGSIKTSGSFQGKSNQLGQGGRAAQLRARGVPGGVIGNLARRAGAAPGQANYHKHKTLKRTKKSSKTRK